MRLEQGFLSTLCAGIPHMIDLLVLEGRRVWNVVDVSAHKKLPFTRVGPNDLSLTYARESETLADGTPNPLVSPVHAPLDELRSFPPTLFHLGSDEVLRDDSRKMHARLQQAGVRTVYEEFAGLPHVWQVFGIAPEAEESLSRVGFFVQDVVRRELHR